MQNDKSRRHSDEQPDIARLLVSSLSQRWKKYLRELRRCKRTLSEDSVHDLRVATRRLISTLTIFEILLPDDRARKIRRRLKRLFDALSPLRDTQVQLLTLEKKVAEFPELETLLTVLRVRERNLMNSIARRILKMQTRPMGRAVTALKKLLTEHLARKEMQRIGLNSVLGVAGARFLSAVAAKERVIATRLRTIHRARIEFKKLRYTLEALAPILPSIGREKPKVMDAYQTRMGNIQDVQVLAALVREFAGKRHLAARRKLSGYQRELTRQKKERIAAYLQSADEIYSLWK